MCLWERGNAALGAQELSDELAAELLTPDFRMENAVTAVTDNTYFGAEGVRERIQDLFDAFDEDARLEAELLVDGENFVVGSVSLVGHGARSGAPLNMRFYAVSWFKYGNMVRSTGYGRRREALEAVGLEG